MDWNATESNTVSWEPAATSMQGHTDVTAAYIECLSGAEFTARNAYIPSCQVRPQSVTHSSVNQTVISAGFMSEIQQLVLPYFVWWAPHL